MSQRTFSDTLEALKKIFFLRPKIEIFLKGRTRVFGQILPNFKSAFFTCGVGISVYHKTPLGIIFKCK